MDKDKSARNRSQSQAQQKQIVSSNSSMNNNQHVVPMSGQSAAAEASTNTNGSMMIAAAVAAAAYGVRGGQSGQRFMPMPLVPSPQLGKAISTIPGMSLQGKGSKTVTNFSALSSYNRPGSSLGSKVTTSKSLVSVERSKNLRNYVERAIAEHKVFTCVGVYPAIKNALKKRGWVEKTGPINVIRSAYGQPVTRESLEEESDAAWVTRNLRDYPADFIWVIRRDNIDWRNLTREQMINRFPKAWFTTKVGLTACLQQMHWFSEVGVADTFFPRCYRLCLEDERQAFQEDYKLTACMSYLRHFMEQCDVKGTPAMVEPNSKVTPLSIDFASRQIGNYIRMRRHEDIDWLLPPNFMSQHWEAFLSQYRSVVQDKRKIRFENVETVRIKYELARKTLQRVAQYWPQSHWDGVYNMWICKPGARSRGKGIVIMNSLEKIMELLSQSNYREANWVVQKYMERPLLIYKTKFDIRQWFIITDWSPLTVWFYKESYVRFCTKPYVLEDFHESIHLCNNAIQCHYKNSELRDSALPDENMWDCYTFQAYLKTIGKMEEWPKVYEGMKQSIIGVLLASQEAVEAKKGAFELYGADFMLSEDFKPWLIEINSCPCMAASTSVTARMCAQCLEDTIKVVVDRRLNKSADTGMFEMVYRQNPAAVQVQQFSGHDLVIQGKKLTRDIDWPSLMGKASAGYARKPFTPSASVMRVQTPVGAVVSPAVATTDNLTFTDLLYKLRMKNAQMFAGFVSQTQDQTLQSLTTGVEGTNKSLTGELLNRMRSLSKIHNNEIIPGMKKVYPSTKGVIKDLRPKENKPIVPRHKFRDLSLPATGFLNSYIKGKSSTFNDLLKYRQQVNEEENDNDAAAARQAQRMAGPNRINSTINGIIQGRMRRTSKNPYLPRNAAVNPIILSANQYLNN